jgi:group I intron endonuclease
MSRIPNTRPTSIYWLIDTRDDIPFYCGKTVNSLPARVKTHKYEAKNGTRPVHKKVRECGNEFRIHLMETVPVEDDWNARESRWIDILRQTNPNCCNVASGGAGAPGWIPSAETRAKLSAMFKGKSTHTPETRAKLSAAGMGKKRSRESVEEGRAKMLGRTISPEQRAQQSLRQKARFAGPHGNELRLAIGFNRKGAILSAETRAKQRAAKLGHKKSAETIEKLRLAGIGRKMSPEAIAKSVAARIGRKRTPEQRARMSAAHKGKQWSQAQHESHKGKKATAAQREAISAGLIVAWARRKAEQATQ